MRRRFYSPQNIENNDQLDSPVPTYEEAVKQGAKY
jgi:hypothetical protein